MHCQHTLKTGGNKEAICYKTDKDKIEPVGIKKKKVCHDNNFSYNNCSFNLPSGSRTSLSGL